MGLLLAALRGNLRGHQISALQECARHVIGGRSGGRLGLAWKATARLSSRHRGLPEGTLLLPRGSARVQFSSDQFNEEALLGPL